MARLGGHCLGRMTKAFFSAYREELDTRWDFSRVVADCTRPEGWLEPREDLLKAIPEEGCLVLPYGKSS